MILKLNIRVKDIMDSFIDFFRFREKTAMEKSSIM